MKALLRFVAVVILGMVVVPTFADDGSEKAAKALWDKFEKNRDLIKVMPSDGKACKVVSEGARHDRCHRCKFEIPDGYIRWEIGPKESINTGRSWSTAEWFVPGDPEDGTVEVCAHSRGINSYSSMEVKYIWAIRVGKSKELSAALLKAAPKE